MSVKFENNTIQVQKAIGNEINAVLEECAGELESAVKRNTRVKTSQTKNAWTHFVDEGKHEATVGNPLENAIWEEFGTGEYALNGDGRKGGWVYTNEEGEKVFTRGKTPTRAFWNAYKLLRKPIVNRLKNALKGS